MKREEIFDLALCLTGSVLASITSIVLFFSTFIFTRNDFKDKNIFKYIAINSIVDGCMFILATLFPISLYLSHYSYDLTTSYLIQFFNYYIVTCFGAILKKLSENLSISIAFYRLIELSKYNRYNKKLSLTSILLILAILSIIETSHVFIWNKIVLTNNGTLYQRQTNEIYIQGFNINKLFIYLTKTTTVLNFLLIILPNLYILIFLKKLFSKRQYLLRISSTFLTNNNRLLKTTNREIQISLLVTFISIIWTLDFILRVFVIYIGIFKKVNSIQEKYGYLINHFCVCILYMSHILCYFLLCNSFRVNCVRFLCVVK